MTDIRIDLDGIRPATDLLIGRLGETIAQIKGHEHPTSSEDFYCLNLTCWLGERMAPVLRRLADEQAETRTWKARHEALADEFVAEVDRLRMRLGAAQPLIDAAYAWAEVRDDRDATPADTRTALDALYETVEQHRVMDLALDTADREQAEATLCGCCHVDGHTRRCGRTATTEIDVPPFGVLGVAAECRDRITRTGSAVVR